jgi:hypothetical protein
MDADIILTGAQLIVNGDELHVRAHDLYVDNPDRRSQPTGNRRAVVHDQADGVTINYNHDYPGGVTIFGPVKIMGALHVENSDGILVPVQWGALEQAVILSSRLHQLEGRIAALENLLGGRG